MSLTPDMIYASLKNENADMRDRIKQLTAENARLREAIIFTIRDGHAHKACVEQMIAALKGTK